MLLPQCMRLAIAAVALVLGIAPAPALAGDAGQLADILQAMSKKVRIPKPQSISPQPDEPDDWDLALWTSPYRAVLPDGTPVQGANVHLSVGGVTVKVGPSSAYNLAWNIPSEIAGGYAVGLDLQLSDGVFARLGWLEDRSNLNSAPDQTLELGGAYFPIPNVGLNTSVLYGREPARANAYDRWGVVSAAVIRF